MGLMRASGLACWSALALMVAVGTALPQAAATAPVATNPILVTATVETVVPSLVTIYTVVPATGGDSALSTVTATVAGQPTVFTTAVPVVAGSITETIISTLSLTMDQVVVSTVGYSTMLGVDTAVHTSNPTTVPAATEGATPAPNPTPVGAVSSSGSAGMAASSSPGEPRVAGSSASSARPSTTSTTSTTSPTPAVGSSASTASTGLSTGAKAGIGVGVAIGIVALATLSFLLGLAFSRRRNRHGPAGLPVTSAVAAGVGDEKDVFRAGRPYEATDDRSRPPAPVFGKARSESRTTTEVGSESMSGKYSATSRPTSSGRHHDPTELSALPPFGKDDEPMYIGVPSHMSGSRRWSTKEYDR